MSDTPVWPVEYPGEWVGTGSSCHPPTPPLAPPVSQGSPSEGTVLKATCWEGSLERWTLTDLRLGEPVLPPGWPK